MGEKQALRKQGRPVSAPGEPPTRERIFNAAMDLFSRHGYEAASVRRIAEAVGITESAVYRHYASKEAILDAIFSYAESRIFTPLPIEQTIGALEGDSIFRGLLAPLPEIIKAEPILLKIMKIIFMEMHRNEKIRRLFRSEFVERANDYMESLFKRCIDLGAVRPCDPRALACVFNAFRSEWTFQTFIADFEKPIDVEKISAALEAPIRLFEQFFIPGRNENRDTKSEGGVK